MGKRAVSITSLTIALLGLGSVARGQVTYTWTQTNAGGNWSTAAWTVSDPELPAVPAEGAGTIIEFFAGTSGAGNSVTAEFTATNDIESGESTTSATTFDLEKLILRGTASSGRTVTIGPGGNTRRFQFIGDENTISFGPGGSLVYTISNSIIISNGLSITSTSNTVVSMSPNRITGGISGSGGLTASGTGRFALTGTLSFSGGLTIGMTGNGRVDISGNNNFSGGTVINSGTVVLGNDNALGSGTLTLNGGVLSNSGLFTGSDPGTNSRDLNLNVVFGGNFQIMNSNIQGGNYTLGASNRTIDLGGATRVISTDGAVTTNATSGIIVSFLGAVTNGGLTKSGRGALRLSHANNSYTGVTTVRMGTLYVSNNAPAGSNGALGNATSAVELGDESTAAANTIRMFISGGNYTVGRNINVNDFNSTGVTILGGSGDIDATYSGKITLSRDVELTSASLGSNAVSFTGDITGNFGVSVTGAGTVRFANTKTYAGLTSIAATSTLRLDGGSIANSAVSVEGTLAGNGQAGAVTVASTGVVSPGNSIGTLSTGTLDFTAGGTYAADLNTSAWQSDRINVNGDLLLGENNAVLSLNDLGSDYPWVGRLVLISYTGTWDGGLFKFNGVDLADGAQFVFGSSTYTIDYDADLGGGVSGVTLIPEPASLSLLALGGVAMLARRRARKSEHV